MKRRFFLKASSVFGIATQSPNWNNKLHSSYLPNGKIKIGANGYNWITFYDRMGKKWGENWDECISKFKQSGITYFEPSITSLEEAKTLIAICKKYEIKLYSIYVNSFLHEQAQAEKTINFIEQLSSIMAAAGTKIFVTNPQPIKWGSDAVKTDNELVIQANNLNRVGEILLKKGIKLAYHTHDIELKSGAKEFHHMLQNTNPKFVFFCYDVHWVYRGCGNSSIAVFDILKMYYNRIIEVHLRQSTNHIWDEIFTAKSDIDYVKIIEFINKKNVKPFWVIEQCLEPKTVSTLDPIAAHKIDLANLELLLNK